MIEFQPAPQQYIPIQEAHVSASVVDRYSINRKSPTRGEVDMAERMPKIKASLVVEAFLNRAMESTIPVVGVETVSAGEVLSVPFSVYGNTTINWVGSKPTVLPDSDEYDNLQLLVSANCALEIIYNSEKMGAAGRNRGAHAKKIIYIVK